MMESCREDLGCFDGCRTKEIGRTGEPTGSFRNTKSQNVTKTLEIRGDVNILLPHVGIHLPTS